MFFSDNPDIASEHALVDIHCAVQVSDIFQYRDFAFFVLVDWVLSESVFGDLHVDEELFVGGFDHEDGVRFGKLFVLGRDEDLCLG